MRKLLFLLLMLLLLFTFIPTMAQNESSAFVRIAHFAVNVGEVNVYINGHLRSIGREMAYGTATSWIIVPAGEFEIAVVPAGRSMKAAIIEPTVLDLEAGSRTTIATIGDAQATAITAHLITEDYDDLPEFQARVTVLHAMPSVGAVDIWTEDELFLGRLAYPGSLTLLEGGNNDGFISFDFLEGGYDLIVVPNGLAAPILLDLTDTEVAAQTYYLIVAAVDEEGNPTTFVFEQTAN